MKIMRVITLLVGSLATSAFAQDEITLKVTPTELNLIGQGLDAQVKAVQDLANKLRQQYVDQQPKPVTPPAAVPKQEEKK